MRKARSEVSLYKSKENLEKSNGSFKRVYSAEGV